MKKVQKQLMAFLLVFAMIFSVSGLNNTVSAAAKIKLSTKKVTLTVGKSKKVTVKNAPKKAKIKWSSKNKKIAKVNAKGKITAVKKGSTEVTCKVTYTAGKKKKTQSFTVKVTVNAKKTTTPTPTPLVETSNLAEEHESANGIKTKDNGQMRDIDAADLMKLMGQGYNLGNTLEASLDKSVITDTTTVIDYECAWGQPLTTQAMFDGMKKYGFNTVRIPTAWSNMVSDDGTYTINEAYFNRVEEVMNYALNNEMYVIINIHWDGDWWGQFGDSDQAIRDQAWARFESYWKQISERYKEYSDRVIFESANEELGDRLNDDWRNMSTYPKTGTLTEDECYEVTNQINQKFVDIVRASGGNNATRHLLIAGYDTDIDKTCDSRFVMPEDTKENGKTKMSISVHYYTPSTFCIAEYDMGWGFSDTWGTDDDITLLHEKFDMMTKFTEQGYGVIIGEYGVCSASKDGIPAFLKEVATYSAQLGMCPVLWETSSWYNRNTGEFKYSDVAQVYMDIAGITTDTVTPESAVTGIPSFETKDQSELELKYTWEGKFVKNDGSNTKQEYSQTSCTDGMKVTNNSWCYYLFVEADWASMKNPYIKVYLDETDGSYKDETLQFAYITYGEPGEPDSGDTHVGDVKLQPADNWYGKCIKLDKEMLTSNDSLYLSFGNGPTMLKFEIYDEK